MGNKDKVGEILEERAKSYGNSGVLARRVISMFNTLRDRDLKPEDVFYFMMCLKLCRENVAHKDDNLDDLCGYARLLQEYENVDKNANLATKKGPK